MVAVPPLRLTGDPEADELLGAHPFALLVGMLLMLFRKANRL